MLRCASGFVIVVMAVFVGDLSEWMGECNNNFVQEGVDNSIHA